jgi:zinc D-Ala-D-Ala carboxypeptidase
LNYGKYFTEAEFKCKHCGAVKMDQNFLDRLNKLRESYGKPMRISSGYRCPEHPAERSKVTTGMHTTGKACDVVVEGAEAVFLLQLALQQGFTGIGVQQKGSGRFLHLDTRDRSTIWSY